MKAISLLLMLLLAHFCISAQVNCFESAVGNIRGLIKKGKCSSAQISLDKTKYCDDKPANNESVLQGLQAEINNCKINTAAEKKNSLPKSQPKENPKVKAEEHITNTDRLKELAKEGINYYLDKNYEKAFPLLDEAKEINDAEVWKYLGYMYDNGYFVKVNPEMSFQCLKKSADLGDAYAQYHVAIRYQSGDGVEKDLGEAYKWYKKSAEQGNSYGQEGLGEFFRTGIFVSKDDVEAVKWFRKSADQNNSYGQLYLGEMYENGEGGLTKSITEAMILYRKSAKQGNSKAKANLKRLGVSE